MTARRNPVDTRKDALDTSVPAGVPVSGTPGHVREEQR